MGNGASSDNFQILFSQCKSPSNPRAFFFFFYLIGTYRYLCFCHMGQKTYLGKGFALHGPGPIISSQLLLTKKQVA